MLLVNLEIVISKRLGKKLFYVGVLQWSPTKGAGSGARLGSGSVSQRYGSGSVPKCHGSGTLVRAMYKLPILLQYTQHPYTITAVSRLRNQHFEPSFRSEIQ
jgi:hypothetical protein